MKPKLMLMVVPFVVTGLLQGCIPLYGMKEDQKKYSVGEEPDCIGYGTPIALGAITILSIVGSMCFLVKSPPPTVDCEGKMFCTQPVDENENIGISLFSLSLGLLTLAAWSLSSANKCSKRKKAYKKWLIQAELEKQKPDLERKQYIKRCEKLKRKYEKLPTTENLESYHAKCREFIKKDINTTNLEGQTKLHIAVKEGSRKKTKHLLFLGSEVNTKDKYGWTPLHYAALSGSEDIVEILLKKGADSKAIDKYGRIPLDLAIEKGHENVGELLMKAARGGE